MTDQELRDRFAMAALQGLLARDTEGTLYWSEDGFMTEKLARDACRAADAMMVERVIHMPPKKQIPGPRPQPSGGEPRGAP